MNNNQDELLVSLVQPRKVIEHFGGDVNEIKQWADLSTKEELLVSIKAFQNECLNEYVDVLNESLNNKK